MLAALSPTLRSPFFASIRVSRLVKVGHFMPSMASGMATGVLCLWDLWSRRKALIGWLCVKIRLYKYILSSLWAVIRSKSAPVAHFIRPAQ